MDYEEQEVSRERDPSGERSGGEDGATDGDDGGESRGRGARSGGARTGRSSWTEALEDVQQVVEDVIEGVRKFPPGVGRGPRLDLVRIPERGYRVYVDVPGVRKEEVEVTTLGDDLVVSGEHRHPELPEGAEVLRAERARGRFRRSLRLPSDVDATAIRARLVEGVLEIALPQRGSVEPRSVDIE